MFDDIKCKKDLPLTEELQSLQVNWKEITFQTKDLDNCLGQYIITEDGKLLEHIEEKEYIPFSDEEKKDKDYRAWSPWKDVLVKGERDEEVPFHGTITFYTYLDYTEEQDIWVDFKAFFVYGKLDKIELAKIEKYTSRTISNKKWQEKAELEEKKVWNKAKKLLSHIGWNWFWKKVSASCYSLSRMFSNIHYFILRYVI